MYIKALQRVQHLTNEWEEWSGRCQLSLFVYKIPDQKLTIKFVVVFQRCQLSLFVYKIPDQKIIYKVHFRLARQPYMNLDTAVAYFSDKIYRNILIKQKNNRKAERCAWSHQ